MRRAALPVVAFPPALADGLIDLKAFLFRTVYRHPRVTRVMDAAEAVVADLFRRYLADAGALPDERRALLPDLDAIERGRGIGDFIAGMTDRFAIAEHKRLFGATPELG